MKSVMLDTSFCIRLTNQDDPLNINAVDYLEYFLENKFIIFVSTIVIAEYAVKEDPSNLPLETMRIAPFDFDDAKKAGEFFNILYSEPIDKTDTNRTAIKDDCKIISQIANRNITHYITNDRKSFRKLIQPIIQAGLLNVEFIDLSIPLTDFKSELPFPSEN